MKKGQRCSHIVLTQIVILVLTWNVAIRVGTQILNKVQLYWGTMYVYIFALVIVFIVLSFMGFQQFFHYNKYINPQITYVSIICLILVLTCNIFSGYKINITHYLNITFVNFGIIAAVEEFVFRGAVFNLLLSTRFKITVICFISGVIFALCHIGKFTEIEGYQLIFLAIPPMSIGVITSIIYWLENKSIFNCIVFHGTINSIIDCGIGLYKFLIYYIYYAAIILILWQIHKQENQGTIRY